MAAHFLGELEGALEVAGEGVVPVVVVDRREGLLFEEARVVDDDVEAAEMLDRGRDAAPDALAFGDVELHRECAAAMLLDLLDDGPGCALALVPRDAHAGAFPGETLGDSAADAPRRSGDDRDLVLQYAAHAGHRSSMRATIPSASRR